MNKASSLRDFIKDFISSVNSFDSFSLIALDGFSAISFFIKTIESSRVKLSEVINNSVLCCCLNDIL